MSRIYALSSVKFPGLKLWLCKKDDKYQVWEELIEADMHVAEDERTMNVLSDVANSIFACVRFIV